MPRKAIFKHATQVDPIAYPDDPSVPIGTTEWNQDHDSQGMLGFTSEILASASTVTPSNSMISITGSTPVSTLSVANANEGDLLFITTTDSVVLQHATGNIFLQGESNLTLSTTAPIILIRKGANWYQFGGLSTANPKATGNAQFQNMSLTGNLTVGGTTTTINSSELTVQDKNITMAQGNNLDSAIDGAGITIKGASDKTLLYETSTANFNISEHLNLASGKKLKIGNVSVFSPITMERTNTPDDPAVNLGLVYVKQLDSNNDGIFIKIKKAGSYQEVQIA